MVHDSHIVRFSDASTFDEVCINCGAHDEVPGGWGLLALSCPVPKDKRLTLEEYYERRKKILQK